MKKIGKLENLIFNDWNNIVVNNKKINRSWGKTYLYVRKGTLYYENLSIIKRIFCTVFLSKKVRQEKDQLWEYLFNKGRVLTDCPKNNFRQRVAHALMQKNAEPDSILAALIKNAEKEEDAFLIDFSLINPSNISKIFAMGWASTAQALGEMVLLEPSTPSSNRNFPFSYSLNIVLKERDDLWIPSRDSYKPTIRGTYTFSMNSEGKIETCGQVFDHFGLYLEEAMRSINLEGEPLNFDHLDIYSVVEGGIQRKLRKKAAPMETA